MKKHSKILFFLAAFLVFSTSANSQPPGDPLQAIQNDINAGRALYEKYSKAREHATDAAKEASNNPTALNRARFTEAYNRQNEAAVPLIANRNKIINDVITHFGLTVPPGQQITYDINCRGACVHGYCSIRCPIALCEKAFTKRDWGGGGTPAWIAAIIKHELKHKDHINPGPPPSWKGTQAQREWEAWQAALKCSETSGLSDIEKNKIMAIKDSWLEKMTASEAIEVMIKVISEWLETFLSSLPDRIFNSFFSIRNYGDTPQDVTCYITDQRNWLIEPNVISLFLVEPGQEINVPVTIHVPDTAVLNTKNEIFCETVTPEGSTLDFMFVIVDPTITVTAGQNLRAHRGENVPISFLVENNPDAIPDLFRIELSSALGWPIVPAYYEAYLMPGEGFTFMSTMDVPSELPYWTTDLVYCRATSFSDPQQTEEKWISVQIIENDICALLIDTPLGENQQGSMIIPAAWVNNTGMVDSFFDVFTEIDLPVPHTDSVMGLSLPAGQEMLVPFGPVLLEDRGEFPVTFYTRAMGDDADHSNDTIRGLFTVTLPEHIYLQNQFVPMGEFHCFEASKTITTGGSETYFMVEPEAEAVLVAGEMVMMQPFTHFLFGSNVHAFIDPSGLYCDLAKSPPGDLAAAGILPEVASKSSGSFFRIFPNPTPGRFTLELQETTSLPTIKVEIFNLVNQRLLSVELPKSDRYLLDLSKERPGIYFIRIQIGGKSAAGKILKY